MKFAEQVLNYSSVRYAFPMIYREMTLEEIDWDDETFRISEELDSSAVLDSLREVGQLNPVMLSDQTPHKVIVCGFRRARALKKLGRRILAQILSPEAAGRAKMFELALWDNVSHRQFSPLEKARALFKLRDFCGVPDEKLLTRYLPILGLPAHESVLRAYLAINHIQPGLRRCLTDGSLTLSSIEILAQSQVRTQDNFASLMSCIRLSASSQKKVLGLLEDLSAMANAPLHAPLENDEVKIILDDPRLSPFQKGEKLYEVLYRFRNPNLSRALERFQAQKRLLGLPGSIRISPHPFFETADLRVEFEAATPQRFRELASALHEASQSPELERIFQVDS